MKSLNLFFVLLAVIGFLSLNNTADAQEKTYVKVYDSTQTFFATVTLDCPYEYEYIHILRDENGIEFGTETRTGKIWIVMNAKSSKGELHVTCNQSIDGLTFERVNVGDEVWLHFSGETGLESWDWFDNVVGWIGGDPDEVISIGTTFVGPLAYDQSSTEPGYSYFVEFQVVDPTGPTTYDATFYAPDPTNGNPLSGVSVTCNGMTQSTDGSGETVFTGLANGDYPYTASYGCWLASGTITVNGANASETVSLEDNIAPVPDVAVLSDVTAECEVTSLTVPTATDACDGTITGVHNATLPITTTTVVTWTYEDAAGNTAMQTQDVIIDDVTDPTITCVGNQTRAAASTHTYVVVGTEFDPVSFDDNCGVSSVENDFNNSSTLAGVQLPEGTTTITWTVIDDAGNQATCSFDVSVSPYVGIESLSSIGVSFGPNPVGDVLRIYADHGVDEIYLVDITGKVLFSSTCSVNEIDFSVYSKGIYFLKVKSDTNWGVQKIMKQ